MQERKRKLKFLHFLSWRLAWCVSICVKEGHKCASLRFNFRCVCEAGTDYWHYFTFNLHVSFIKKKATWSFFLFKYLKTWLWHPDMPTLLRWSWYFYTTDDAIETWITNKNMKQRKKRFTKSCLSEKKEKFFLRANAWICSDIYLRGYNYRHLFY